jgi:hypothetical protein
LKTKTKLWLIIGAVLLIYFLKLLIVGITKFTIAFFAIGLIMFLAWIIWEGRRSGFLAQMFEKKE